MRIIVTQQLKLILVMIKITNAELFRSDTSAATVSFDTFNLKVRSFVPTAESTSMFVFAVVKAKHKSLL
jgi:hypothetical protein